MNTEAQMRIESVKEDNDKITVVTTGARYIIDKSGEKGKISCYQLLNRERLIATIDFSLSFIKKLIDRVLAVNSRFYLGSPETEREKLLKKEYFPKLKRKMSKK